MRPLFIGGYPKSGTTLMLSLLDGHPDLLVFPEETMFFGSVLPLLKSGASRRELLEFVCEQTGVKWLQQDQVADGAGSRDYSAIDFDRYRSSVESLWSLSQYSAAGLLEALAVTYGLVTGQDVSKKKYWVEKSPGNEHYIREILRLFPEASFVCNLRDPRANYLSYRKKRKTYLDHNMSVEEFLLGWITSLHAMTVGDVLFSEPSYRAEKWRSKYLVVLYEQLTTSPRDVMKSIANEIDIIWDDCLLRPTRLNQPWDGNSMHGYTFTGVSAEPVSVWKVELDKKDIQVIESIIGERLFTEMGWGVSQRALARRPRLLGDGGMLLKLLVRRNGLPIRPKAALIKKILQLHYGSLARGFVTLRRRVVIGELVSAAPIDEEETDGTRESAHDRPARGG